jgi:hypothetical protein
VPVHVLSSLPKSSEKPHKNACLSARCGDSSGIELFDAVCVRTAQGWNNIC